MARYNPNSPEDMTFDFGDNTYMMRHTGGRVSRVWIASADSIIWQEQNLADVADVVAAFEASAASPAFAAIPRFFNNPLKLDDHGAPV